MVVQLSAVKEVEEEMEIIEAEPTSAAVATWGVYRGIADWDLEEFLARLEEEGTLEDLRNSAKCAAMRRRGSGQSLESQDDMRSEMEDWDAWTSTESSTSGDSEYVDALSEMPSPSRWGLKQFVSGSAKSRSANINDESRTISDEGPLVCDADLDEFLAILGVKEDSYPSSGWKIVLNKQTDVMSYRSWCRDPPGGSTTEYLSRMILENCPAEVARDFFLDEDYRAEWDESRLRSCIIEDWDENGHQFAQWVRKFPFFLRDREYVVSRKIWSITDRTYHCVAKLTGHPSAPEKPNPMRVKEFQSRWRIGPTDSRFGKGFQACEMVNLHQECSGLARNLARMAVSRGMWTYVQKMEKALRAYSASGRNANHCLPIFLMQADAEYAKRKSLDADKY